MNSVDWPKWGLLALEDDSGLIDLTDGARRTSALRYRSVETFRDGVPIESARLELVEQSADLPPEDEPGRLMRLVRLSVRGTLPPPETAVVRLSIIGGMDLEEAAGAFEQFSSVAAEHPRFEAANLFRMMGEPTGWVATGFYAAAPRLAPRRATAKRK